MSRSVLFASIGVLVIAGGVRAEKSVFSPPSDDRWHYWINQSTGSREVASTFAAPGSAGANADFNDRDGMVYLVWDTSSLITPGLGAENYNITSIGLTVTNLADAIWAVDLTVDEWFTYDLNGDGTINADGFPRGHASDTDGESDDTDPGRTVELYGAGFDDDFTLASWNEFSAYEGAEFSGPPFFGDPTAAREPFPFVYQDVTLDKLHVEDHVRGLHNDMLATPVFEFTPQPWAVGVPQGYTPGAQSVPFDIVFDVDLTAFGGEAKRYFQEQLDAGRVFIIVSAAQETTQSGAQDEFPTLFMKEANDVGAKPAELRIEIASIPGDFDGDGDVDLDDYASFPGCMSGPGGGLITPDCGAFDFDSDVDVDLKDAQAFTLTMGL